MKNELDNKVKEIKDKYLSGITDKLQLEYIIHYYILNNTEYDHENYINGTIPNISHSSHGSLINGKAVCDGYSKSAKLLFDEVGIESGIIISEEMNHSWNYVNIDNKYYHLDITWDDPAPETNRIIYSYFNLSDTEMAKDHIWVSDVYPQCNNKEFSFLRNTSVDCIARINNKIYTLNNGKLQYSNLYGNNKAYEKDNIYGKYLTSYKNNLIFIGENSYNKKVVKYNIDNKTMTTIHDVADYIYVKENSLYAKNGTSVIVILLQEKEDFNDDGTVDIKDLAELSLKYGQTNSSSQWNSKYDLNNDGIIDIYDLILVSKLI